MRFTLALCALVLVAFVSLFAHELQHPIKADVPTSQGKVRHGESAEVGRTVIHVLRANEDNEAVFESVASPLFAAKVEQGSVDGAGILECIQKTETREVNRVSYPAVVLECGVAKLVLVGIDLTVKR